jgi:photosystem II stability/assembly factor-like uncharacterized protein
LAKSADGITWTEFHNIGSSGYFNYPDMRIYNGFIYIVHKQAKFAKSDLSALSWSNVDSSVADINTYAGKIFVDNNQIIILTKTGIQFKSIDSGTTWTKKGIGDYGTIFNNAPFYQNGILYQIIYTYKNSEGVSGGYALKLIRSNNMGESWY